LVRRLLRVVCTTTRYSADRPSVRSQDRPAAPADFVSLSGFGPKRPHRSCLNGSPLLGFLAPSATSAEGSCAPGLPLPAPSVLGVSHPLDGLLSLRPRGHARSAAALGVFATKTLSNGKAVTHRCVRCVLSSMVLCGLELWGIRGPKAPWPPRRLSLPDLVPRTWFQSLAAPYGAHHSRTVAGAFAPAHPPARFVLGVWASAFTRKPRRVGTASRGV